MAKQQVRIVSLSLSEMITLNPLTLPAFQLASIDANNIPRVRSCIHREFLGAKASPSLPLLLSTTDIRTPKCVQILSNPDIECVFWAESTQEQYRVTGKISIIPTPAHPYYAQFDPFRGPALTALKNEGIDWEEKRTESFNSMSAHMKATWCRPAPGSKLDGGYEEGNKWPDKLPKLGEAKNEEEKRNLEQALGNFALMVIDPVEVDFVELGVVPNQRTKFTREGGKWVEQIVVP